jgi:hypothetical protein
MQITEDRVSQYMELYLKEYGIPIDKVQARNELTSLVCLMEAVYKFNNKLNTMETRCPACQEPVDSDAFRDEISIEEFKISGFCQGCQDLTFNKPWMRKSQ